MPLGLRVNCTEEASARYSFCLEMADLIRPAMTPPSSPTRYKTRPTNSRPTVLLLLLFVLLRARCETALRIKSAPISPIKVMPRNMAMSRMLKRISPFRMWLNSCPITPCSSSRVSWVRAPWVIATTASPGEIPAAKALIPGSLSRIYSGGTGILAAKAIS